MKTNFMILFCLVFITFMAAPGWCQPDLVYVENDLETKIDGIDGLKPYYIDAGEKKFFAKKGDIFLRKNDCDILSFGYAPVNYIVKNVNKNCLEAIVRITDESRESAWNRLPTDSLLKIWDEDDYENAIFFLCWYEPNSDFLRIGGLQQIKYYDGKLYGITLWINIEPEKPERFPVIFLWNNDGPIPPKSYSEDNKFFFHSVILGELEKFDVETINKSLYESEDVVGNMAIHYAAAFGRAEILEKLLVEGADVDAENENGMTPLLLATSAGRKNIVDLLIRYKANTKCKDDNKRTALHYSSYCGHAAIVEELLKHKNDINKADIFHKTPVHYAINEQNESIVGLLADSKAKVHSDKENLQGTLISHIAKDNYNIVTFLLDQKAKPDGTIYGTTPLVVAAGSSNVEMVDMLIERGADVNKPNRNQITPLLSACLTGRPEVVKYLLEKDAKVDTKSANGLSALQAAVLRNDPEMIELLVSYGVDIEEKDEAGKTPFWNAAILGHRESMEKLLEIGATCNLNMKDAIGLMELAFRYDMPEAVNLALSQCLDANFLFYDKYPSTWVAEYYEADEILDLLIESGAEKNTGADLGIIPTKDLSEKPSILKYSSIYYPLELKRKYGSRKFLVQIVIDEQGKALFPKMVDSEVPEIERIVMETITNWRFTIPKNASGQPCRTIANLPIMLECEDIEKRTWECTEIDQVPTVLKSFPPKYPFELGAKGIQGRVVLRIILDETGKAEKISIESMTHKGFAEAAIAAAEKYEFSPGYYQGKPVKVVVLLPVIFDLQ